MYDKTVRRRRAVLALLVAGSLILLTAYFGESAGGGLHSVQRGILEVVSPIQEGASRALKPFRDLFGWVGDTVRAKGELKDVSRDRDAWRKRAIASEVALSDNAHLRNLLDLDRQLSLADYGPVTARVDGQSPTLWYIKLNINKGTADGVQKDMPVLGTDGSADGTGLVGRVEVAGSHYSVVRLITDSTVNVPARTIKGTGTNGVVSPKVGNPNDLILKFVARGADIRPGDVVVTAGTTSKRDDLASIYPRDLPIGRITRVDDPGSETQEVHLKPFVDPRQVAFVQVLTKRVNFNR